MSLNFYYLSNRRRYNFMEKFLAHAKIHFERTGQPLGAVCRSFVMEDGYELGESLHKFRAKETYLRAKNDPEYVERLKAVGYTESSIQAGVDRFKRSGATRSSNGWTAKQPALRALFKKNGHINTMKGLDLDQLGLSVNLLPKNYSSFKVLVMDLRRKNGDYDKPERALVLKSMNGYRSTAEFDDHRFDVGLGWWTENGDTKWPPQQSKIPTSLDVVPIYIRGLNIGNWYYTRQRTGRLTDKQKKLIENNNKPLRFMKPEKKKKMSERVRQTYSDRFDTTFYERRGWTSTLKKWPHLRFGFVSHYMPSKYRRGAQYCYRQQLLRPKRKNQTFCKREKVSKYNSRLECYMHVRKEALRAFYFRKWFLVAKLLKQ